MPTFRIVVPVYNFGVTDIKLIQDDKPILLYLGATYLLNTSRLHSVFSFVNNCLMLVLNVNASEDILNKMVKKVVAI